MDTASPRTASPGTRSTAHIADATPDSRDRYVDLLRVASLAVVVVGHWLMAAVVVGPDGAASAGNLLTTAPWLHPVTWLLQVIPVFFLVGGFSHATALDSLARRGGGYAEFVRARAGRLLRPTLVFVAVWLAVALVVELLGHDRGVPALALAVVAQPLWFLGVYLGVVALAPPMLRLHRRLGTRAVAVPVGLAVAVVAVDVLRIAAEVEHVGYLNVAFVWLAVHQMGFFYADGTLQRGGRRLAGALTLGGLAALVVLTGPAPYPVSMVGLPGELSNMAPPTVALLAQAVFLIGVVLLLRGPATVRLRRPVVWRAVVRGNVVAMTAYLWHLTALFVAVAAATALGLPEPAVGDWWWWLGRPAWIGLLAVLTAAMVTGFGRLERLPTRGVAPTPGTGGGGGGVEGTTTAAVAAALCAVGVLGLSTVGFSGALAGRTALLVVVPVTPLTAAAALMVGATVLLHPLSGRVARGAGEADRGPLTRSGRAAPWPPRRGRRAAGPGRPHGCTVAPSGSPPSPTPRRRRQA